MSETKMVLPVICLAGKVLLPRMSVYLDLSREEQLNAVDSAMSHDHRIYIVAQLNPDSENPGLADLYRTGVIAEIKSLSHLPKSITRIMVKALTPAMHLRLEEYGGSRFAEVEECPWQLDEDLSMPAREAMRRALQDLLQRYGLLNTKFAKEGMPSVTEQEDLIFMLQEACVQVPLHVQLRQRILDTHRFLEAYEQFCTIIAAECETLQIRNEIQQKVKDRIDKNQREYILREQLKVISEELGENTLLSEAENYKKEASCLQASEEVKKRIEKEADRLKAAGNNSAEAAVIRTYIETLLEMPWEKTRQEKVDLAFARQVLEEDHYGLEKVKERILEFLAVRIFNQKGESPILCLVGPPGTGKTSIARSIARALDKEYVRISLGGIRDEAEIRGHRRTYVGAMPGRFANALRQAKVNNPLMLLDEIDKVSSDYKGDTASALLEVLDSEQNIHFRDHYIDLPVDLSQVFFIATANDLHTIPRPLLDRMEVLEITSYTENEKLHIAREHLIPRQLERHGLTTKQLSISKSALEKLISGYTREAGVRQLERRIAELCRKAAISLLEEPDKKTSVTGKNLEKLLGKKKYSVLKKNHDNEIGIVRGLAWTSVGGDTLQIEVSVMPGKGELLLTGQLGDVMKESARIAISFIRSIGDSYQLGEDTFQTHDLHVHIPEGAVPKDGPSAGITMATAILSAVAGIPVQADLAMTGEITLRGRVLPIGGLKEKLLAAKKAGIHRVLVPADNKADVEEISAEITEGLTIVYVKTMKEVLQEALILDYSSPQIE